MAVVKSNGQTINVNDGEAILDACEELGVNFGCQAGNCGACLTEVASGMQNLSAPSEAEKQFGVEGSERLMCQCLVKGGEVTLDI